MVVRPTNSVAFVPDAPTPVLVLMLLLLTAWESATTSVASACPPSALTTKKPTPALLLATLSAIVALSRPVEPEPSNMNPSDALALTSIRFNTAVTVGDPVGLMRIPWLLPEAIVSEMLRLAEALGLARIPSPKKPLILQFCTFSALPELN